MLRRKLILNLCPLVLLLAVTAIIAIGLLQGVLGRLDEVRQLDEMKQHVDIVGRLEVELARFRTIVLGLGIVFLALINLSVVLLIRAASKVLRPVGALLEATRQLTQERFAHRVNLQEHDEFDELANAYNLLAEHLQETEKQRMSVLGQVGLALNHDLNNAMATIELQLGMLGRNAGADLHTERRLRTIHESLTRMRDTVQALKNVRRIVLTDYSPGMKMLDLALSVKEDQAPEPRQELAP